MYDRPTQPLHCSVSCEAALNDQKGGRHSRRHRLWPGPHHGVPELTRLDRAGRRSVAGHGRRCSAGVPVPEPRRWFDDRSNRPWIRQVRRLGVRYRLRCAECVSLLAGGGVGVAPGAPTLSYATSPRSRSWVGWPRSGCPSWRRTRAPNEKRVPLAGVRQPVAALQGTLSLLGAHGPW